MNAINFIKHHGIEKARKVVEGAPKWAMSINFNNGMYYSRMEHKKGDTFLYDIKRLVESVDLINRMGDLIQAKLTKAIAEEIGYKNDADALRQAIADYILIYGDKNA